jgi:uncharacterized membrane protein (DUF441 family)
MENWFEYFKDRRFVPIFFVTLAVLLPGIAAGGILLRAAESNDLLKYWPGMVAIVLAVFIAVICRAVLSARARRRDRHKLSPLSRDELSKARSKLVKQ